MTCTGCSGSGYQLCWLTYNQDVRWVITIHPESPVVSGHRQLGEDRFLTRDDLDAFYIETIHEAAGVVSVEGYRDAGPAILRAVASSLNPQTERVSHQQYLKLAVVRRDVHYEMCATKGTLVLSGNELTPSPTFWAVKPIQLRLQAWAGLSSIAALVLLVTMLRLRGTAPYFAGSNTAVTVMVLLFAALLMATFATLLRALRPGMKLGPISALEKGVAAGAALSLVALIVTSAVAQPRPKEVDAALARGDVGRARQVVEALYERQGKSNEALEADDAVGLHEAKSFDPAKRLEVLDRISARGGSHAQEAQTRARADRLERIRAQNTAKNPKAALAAIEQWFSATWKNDRDIAEERARAHGLMAAACKTEACRFSAARLADEAASTPDRVRAKDEAKLALVAALGHRDTPNEETLPRLKRLRELVALSHETAEAAKGDAATIEASQESLRWATAERAKVPLLGAEVSVAGELLEGDAIPSSDGKAARVTHEGVAIYLTLDTTKRVRGIYAAGTTKPRAFKNEKWSANRILSQAVGRAVEVKKPATGSYDMVNARWFEAPTHVHARFNNTELIELRVGDAAP